MADVLIATARALASQLQPLDLREQMRQFAGIYQRHTAVRAALVAAQRAAMQRAKATVKRQSSDRGDHSFGVDAEREIKRVAASAAMRRRRALDYADHADIPGHELAPIAHAAIVDIVAAIVGTLVDRKRIDETEALQTLADQFVCHLAQHGDVDRVTTPDENGFNVVTSTGYNYLLGSLHRRENAPQRLLVATMLILDYDSAKIRHTLAEAKGESMDARLARRLIVAANTQLHTKVPGYTPKSL